jgi:hypothetical protein
MSMPAGKPCNQEQGPFRHFFNFLLTLRFLKEKKIMNQHIKTPSGDLIAIRLIDRVFHITKKGVMVMDGYGRVLAYIKLEDDALAIRVRDLFNEVVSDRRNAKQPDWSFLTSPRPVPSVTKATKG